MKHDHGNPLVRGEEQLDLRVIYSPKHHIRKEEDERGFITSWNRDYVFVRFDGDTASKACRREDLYP